MHEANHNEAEHKWVRSFHFKVLGLAGLFLLGVMSCCIFFPAVTATREQAREVYCRHHLKHIAIALQNYHKDYGSFPPACITDETGKPLHSWRVLLLPYLNQKSLFKQYKFDEPWDGPNNRKLHTHSVDEYSCPSDPSYYRDHFTSYLAITGEGTIWRNNKGVSKSAVTDPHYSTIILVEAAETGIHWMEPVDIPLTRLQQPDATWPPLGKRANDKFLKNRIGFFEFWENCEHALVLEEMKVLRIKPTATLNDLLPLFTIDGKEMTSAFFEKHVFDER
jgi:hypothetical protein